ncbi:MAG: hypothetical protein NVS3B20_24860 [Polyangiales bacterium]
MSHYHRSTRIRQITAALLVAVTTSATLPAIAQSDEDRAGARQLARDGKKAVDEKRWADAIDLFTRAESLVHSPTHLLFLARAQVNVGHLVKAREIYLRIQKEQLPAGAPKAFEDAKSAADTELEALEPRIPELKIVVEGAASDAVVVTMDGVVVSKALVGVSRPLDPGDHKVTATSTGLAAEGAVTVIDGANETLTLKLKPTDAAPAATITASAASAATPESTASSAPPPTTTAAPKSAFVAPAADVAPDNASSSGSGLRTGAYLSLGVGVVGLAAGTIFLLRAGSKKQKADDLCPNAVCPLSQADEINQLDSDAKSARTLSTVGFIVGGVGLIGGVMLFLLSGSEPTKSAGRPSIQPFIGLNSAGFMGRF